MIYLDDGESVTSDETDPGGFYKFSGLENQEYFVCEELPAPNGETWVQSYPDNDNCGGDGQGLGGWDIFIEDDFVDDADFGNYDEGEEPPATDSVVSGYKFWDENGDGCSGCDGDEVRKQRYVEPSDVWVPDGYEAEVSTEFQGHFESHIKWLIEWI